MAASIQGLFESVRGACSAAAWSRGVELVRAAAVSGERDDGAEIAVRVATRGGLVSPRVVLYPQDGDWECDCPSRESACEHVAAAAIELRRAREEGRAIGPASSAPGRVGYRFARRGGALEFARVVVGAGGEEPLRSTLSAITSGRVEGPRFLATPADLAAESAVGTRRGEIPRGLWPRLLAALEGCPDVTLDGEPVRTSVRPVGLRARVEEAPGGVRLAVQRDERATEVFRDGVALCGAVLCPIGQASLSGRELEELGRGRVFGPGELVELVTRILPSLEGRVDVDVRARLPQVVEARPRVRLEVMRRGDALSVLPTLVYGDPPLARVDGERLVALGGSVPRRDEEAERALRRRLAQELQLQPGHRLELRGEAAVELAERLRRWPGAIRGEAHQGFFRAPPLEPRCEITPRGFELRFECAAPGDSSLRRADPARVLHAWRERQPLVALEGGGYAPLPVDWLARFGDALADLLAARLASGELPRCALPDLARLAADLGQPEPPDFAGLRALALGDGVPAARLPGDLRAVLRHYQREGVDWLCALRDAGLGALLADDMGLGKTLQALCAVRGRSLVVAPTSVLDNWAREIERFRPALRTALYHGPGRALDPGADVTLTTWAVLRLDADALAEVEWDAIVLDEAQAIKNPRSQVARAAFRLRGSFRLSLSGTPVENRLDELWSQLHFANPGLLGGHGDFEERYARPIERGDPEAAARLRRRVRPFVLRRLKKDVAPELPPRTEVVLRPVLSDAERAVYDAVRAATRRDVLERLAAGGGVLAALEALLRLRQAACHRALVPGQAADGSAKLELLLELLDASVADAHKALVFSQWTSLLDLVEPHLERAGIAFLRLDGATRDRAAVVDRFQDPQGAPVLLATLKAGGVGLNLTAADHVFLLDPWWNPAAEDQAADRAHRIGQEKPVVIHRLVARDTVEERVLALQAKKRQLAEAALGGAAAGAPLTRDDLLALLE